MGDPHPSRRQRNPLVRRAASIYFIAAEEAPGPSGSTSRTQEETTMAWTTPTLVEICIGLEINGYLPAEF